MAPLLNCAVVLRIDLHVMKMTAKISFVCNNQNHLTSLKMLGGYRTSELL